jgi:hypothetical protein
MESQAALDFLGASRPPSTFFEALKAILRGDASTLEVLLTPDEVRSLLLLSPSVRAREEPQGIVRENTFGTS